MGLGLAALGRPGYINLGHQQDLKKDYNVQKMLEHTHRMLDTALAAGITYFDAAQSYGKSELFLSDWLQKKSDQIVVGSKWGYYYTADWQVAAEHHEIKEHSITRLNAQWPESHKRLRPYLKLYQIHSATFESGVLENRKILERLDEIRSEGIVIGLSLSGSGQKEVLEKALTIRVQSEPLFGSVQATYNVLETSVGEKLKEAHDLGLGIIIKEGVANGRLTSRNVDSTYISLLEQIAKEYSSSIDAVALAYILSQGFVDIVLSGAATPEHLTSNLNAMDINLEKKHIEDLLKLKVDPKSYWSERSRMQWN